MDLGKRFLIAKKMGSLIYSFQMELLIRAKPLSVSNTDASHEYLLLTLIYFSIRYMWEAVSHSELRY